MYNDNNYLSDNQIRRRLIAEKRRRRRRKQIIIVCISIVLSVLDGFLAGKIIGSRNIEVPQTSVAPQEEAVSVPEYISTSENIPIVTTAMNEISSDNNGGRKFWSWYGYDSRVSWCACFVSWCEDQAGYLSSGEAPKFAYVPDGSDWFKSRGQWLNAGETPSAGDLIFFDWEQDGGRDHVGIVTAVVGDRVFTVEGNSSDRCRQKRYMLDDPVIYGYGHIANTNP